MEMTINMKQFVELVRMAKYLVANELMPKDIAEEALFNISMEQKLPMIYI